MSKKKKKCLPIIFGFIIVASISSACDNLSQKPSTESTEQTSSIVKSINGDNASKPIPPKTITTTVMETTSPGEKDTSEKPTTIADITEKNELTTSTKATLKTAATTTKKKKTTTTTTSTAASTTKKKKKTTTTTTKATTTITTTVATQATTTTYRLRTYIINWNSYIVHRPSCRTLKYSDDYWPDHYEYVENLDINWADANGLRGCEICTPEWHN